MVVRRRRLVSFVRAMGLVLLVDTDAAAAAAAVTAAHGIAADEDGLLLRFMMVYFGRQGRKRRYQARVSRSRSFGRSFE